jgi:hypothetical protein
MAIVINGSGTITGLSVGGLPDGTVDEGTLATDSVTSAKLKSDAITASDLPSGSVLQVLNGTQGAYATATSSTYVNTGISQTITPSSTSSKIFVLISACIGNANSAKNNNVRIMRDSTELVSFSRVMFNGAGHSSAQQIFSYLDSPNTTSAVSYKLQMMTDSGTLRLNDSSGDSSTSVITLMEIAG